MLIPSNMTGGAHPLLGCLAKQLLSFPVMLMRVLAENDCTERNCAPVMLPDTGERNMRIKINRCHYRHRC